MYKDLSPAGIRANAEYMVKEVQEKLHDMQNMPDNMIYMKD